MPRSLCSRRPHLCAVWLRATLLAALPRAVELRERAVGEVHEVTAAAAAASGAGREGVVANIALQAAPFAPLGGGALVQSCVAVLRAPRACGLAAWGLAFAVAARLAVLTERTSNVFTLPHTSAADESLALTILVAGSCMEVAAAIGVSAGLATVVGCRAACGAEPAAAAASFAGRRLRLAGIGVRGRLDAKSELAELPGGVASSRDRISVAG